MGLGTKVTKGSFLAGAVQEVRLHGLSGLKSQRGHMQGYAATELLSRRPGL